MLRRGPLALLVLLSYSLYAEEFVLRDIRVQGLQRITAGAVFSELPVTVGDRFDESLSASLIGVLYRTGFFDDVSIERSRNDLVITVVERPGIASIGFDGNKGISDEQLAGGLTQAGVAIGRVFDRRLLERLTQELTEQYQALGKFSARINTEILELPDNQVEIKILIDEGEISKIKEFEITGNRRIKDQELFEKIESGAAKWYEFWSGKNNYSKIKLAGDLEALRDAYFDRGYLDFEVKQARVSLSRDKRDIYVSIGVEEGERYRIGDVTLSCRLDVDRDALKRSVVLRKGAIFSRAAAVLSSDAIEFRLKNAGYAGAKVNVVPDKDEEQKTVDVAFLVTSGPKTYVRRINFHGNDGTDDEVFRRELRQLEGAEYSAGKIELSKRRLQRLPYIQSVDVKEQAVEGKEDQIDVEIELVETRSGNISLGAGYSDADGAVISFGLRQDNFLGTGNRVGFNFNNSAANTNYTFSFFDPFYTINGVGRSWSLSYRSVDNSERNINDTSTEEAQGRLGFSIPFSESDTLNVGATLQDIKVDPGSNIGRRLGNYYGRQCGGREAGIDGADVDEDGIHIFDVDRNGLVDEDEIRFDDINDCEFLNLIATAGLDYDTRDRAVFPTDGTRIGGNVQWFIPLDGLAYYKADYFHRHYTPLDKDADYVFAARARVSYANEYGKTVEVPPYDRFFAGGANSVRGYLSNSLGPADNNNDPLGGNFRMLFGTDLFFPTDFLYDRRRFRVSAFADYGNVFSEVEDFSLSEMRGSYGLQFRWLTPVGGISFNFASHFKDEPGDRIESFQFDLGTSF